MFKKGYLIHTTSTNTYTSGYYVNLQALGITPTRIEYVFVYTTGNNGEIIGVYILIDSQRFVQK